MSLLYLLFAVFFGFAGVVSAHADDTITFAWRANPDGDEVIGYRLYYGSESRFTYDPVERLTVSSNLKTDFSYEYYLDFTSWQRCPADMDGLGCEPLPDDMVTCKNLYQDNPVCTITGLSDQLYFTMTAYNAWTESGYSEECMGDQLKRAKVAASVLPAIRSLLLK